MENAACHFVFYTGPRKGEAQAYDTARISIGRSSGSDFRLEAFQLDQVSSHHAEILLEDGNTYVLYDLGTKSGTYINGERVHERATLMHEDYIQFGKEGPEVIFRIGRPMPGKQPLPQIFPVTAELEFFSGSDAGRIFPINAAVVSNIGRRADLEIPLDPRGDMIVSGNHCNIRYINGHFVLTDSSRNGTYVNKELLDQPMEIIEGDVIMLGDGGPQARFHIDMAKRHYPNHRALSPVVKKEEPAESAFSKKGKIDTGTAGAAGAAQMASAAPYSSGSPLSGQQGVDEPAAAIPAGPETAGEIDAVDVSPSTVPEAVPEAALPHNDESEMDFFPDEDTGDSDNENTEPPSLPAAADATESETAKPAGRKFALPAAVPALHKLKFKPGKKVILGAIAVVVVIGLIALLTSGDDPSGNGAAARGDYEEQMENLELVSNASGGFKVQVPAGWTTLNRENYVSTESADKEIAVDYVRDAALSEAKMRQMLARNGAQVEANVEERTVDGVTVKTITANAGKIRRIASLHQAGGGAPALALLESTEKAMERLDEDIIDQLLVKNVELVGAGPTAAATTPAPPAATPSANLPTPAAAATATPSATPVPVESPTPTPAATAAASPSPAAANQPTPAAGGPRVESKALNLAITAPTGWTAVSEEADAMLTIADGKGLEIRIARDPGELDADATFEAMVEEGWTKDGTKTDPKYQAGEFSKEGQNLLLVLIPEKAKTTVVIYATSEKDFTEEQRYGIINVIQQLVAAQGA